MLHNLNHQSGGVLGELQDPLLRCTKMIDKYQPRCVVCMTLAGRHTLNVQKHIGIARLTLASTADAGKWENNNYKTRNI